MDAFVETIVNHLLGSIKQERAASWLSHEFPLISLDGMTIFDLVDDATIPTILSVASHLSGSPLAAVEERAVLQAIADQAALTAFAESAN